MKSFFAEIVDARGVLKQLVIQQLILRYRRTVLGYLWTLVNPLLMMTVMALVFSSLYKSEFRIFAIFLFAGMIPWNFFNSVVSQSGSSLINNEGLIKKIYLPKAIFPLSIAIAQLVDSLLSFLALFIIIAALGGTISWSLFFIPLCYALLFCFALGVGLIVSIVTIFFRDLQHIIVIAMQGIFFLTPILYKKDALDGLVALLVDMNPVTIFISIFRAPLVDGMIPSQPTLLMAALISVISLIAGLLVFAHNQNKIIYRL